MSIQIGEIMIPCRTCGAAPGDDCTTTTREGKNAPIPAFATGVTRNAHKRRIKDAKKVSDLLDW